MNDYVAIICEGEAEKAIIELLLDADCLVFNKSDLLEEEVLYRCKAQVFESQYLNRNFGERRIHVVRVHDSRTERFVISKPYQAKISKISSYHTRPEIEMLIIIAENKYDEYKRKYVRKMKPSEYCMQFLGYRKVKKYHFIKDYFKDVKMLINALREYNRTKHDSRLCIYDLIKESMR